MEHNNEKLHGFSIDDGTEINPELVPKPSLCVLCRKDDNPKAGCPRALFQAFSLAPLGRTRQLSGEQGDCATLGRTRSSRQMGLRPTAQLPR
jgi:hypothetical protein